MAWYFSSIKISIYHFHPKTKYLSKFHLISKIYTFKAFLGLKKIVKPLTLGLHVDCIVGWFLATFEYILGAKAHKTYFYNFFGTWRRFIASYRSFSKAMEYESLDCSLISHLALSYLDCIVLETCWNCKWYYSCIFAICCLENRIYICIFCIL